MPRNRAGRFNGTITIRRKTKVQDSEGGFETLWQKVGATLPAIVEGLAAKEAMMEDALQGASAYRITVRFGADVGTGDQIILDTSSELNVASVVAPVRRGGDVTILATTASVQDEAA